MVHGASMAGFFAVAATFGNPFAAANLDAASPSPSDMAADALARIGLHQHKRGGPFFTTLGRPCDGDGASQCGVDAPFCDFPFLFQPAPYNKPQKVCMKAPNQAPCRQHSDCTTQYCNFSTHKCTASPNYVVNTHCKFDVDCTYAGRCGQQSDVSIDGHNLVGTCLIPGTLACTNSTGCSTGSCIGYKVTQTEPQPGYIYTNAEPGVCPADSFGQPCLPGVSVCGGSDLSQSCGPRTYTASTELADGSFAFSTLTYTLNYCQPDDWDIPCTSDGRCTSGRCIDTRLDGSRRCAFGAAEGARELPVRHASSSL
ncbi:hypothetical protein OC834_007432 [Tilletia horrida]|nr:hypothetical protein OC834_007432 [Tilletia horrida]